MARKSRKAAASVAAVPAAPAAKVWRCAVYARLSCRNNGLAGDSSLRAQVDFVRDSLSGMEGVEVVGVYEDKRPHRHHVRGQGRVRRAHG